MQLTMVNARSFRQHEHLQIALHSVPNILLAEYRLSSASFEVSVQIGQLE